MSSFYLWLDHKILNDGEAFINHSGNLYEEYDPNYDGISSIYSSPFRQWVYDSSVIGANIPSGVTLNNNTFLPRGTSGLSLDFNKGRVIFDSNLVVNKNLSANFAFKEFNLYYTNEKDEQLLFENSYPITSTIQGITGGLGYQDLPFPCVFIKNRITENSPFSFGGLDNTETSIRCVVLATNSFSLDSLLSIAADSFTNVFPVLNNTELPFNYLGDLKLSTPFDYKNICNSYANNSLAFIKNVTVSKLDEIKNSKTNKKSIGALIDFDISNIRQT